MTFIDVLVQKILELVYNLANDIDDIYIKLVPLIETLRCDYVYFDKICERITIYINIYYNFNRKRFINIRKRRFRNGLNKLYEEYYKDIDAFKYFDWIDYLTIRRVAIALFIPVIPFIFLLLYIYKYLIKYTFLLLDIIFVHVYRSKNYPVIKDYFNKYFIDFIFIKIPKLLIRLRKKISARYFMIVSLDLLDFLDHAIPESII